jgi:hypothetical protein
MSRLTIKQPFSFWASINGVSFSNEQVTGSTVNITEDSHAIERVTGATLADSHTINWEVVHPIEEDDYTATFSSSDEGIATVDASGVLTVVSDGEVTITVTVSRTSDSYSISNSTKVSVSISAGASIDYISNKAGTAGEAMNNRLETLVSNSDPSTAKPRFSSVNTSTNTFTRNEDFWGIGLSGLSAVSPNNSRGGNRRAGTAITKRHIICTAHYPLYVGDTIDFVANISGSTTAVTRTIQKVKTHPLYAGQSGNYCYDVQICLLDSDLPSGIDIMEIIPSNAGDYTGQYDWMSTAIAVFDQEQKGLTRLQTILSKGIYFGSELEKHWFSSTPPSSMVNGLSYIPSFLGFSTTSDRVSTRLVSNTDELYTLNENIVVGDSGAPNCFVLGSKLVLIGLNTTPSAGAYLSNLISDINQLITDVDTLAGISTGYTVTECDLSAYPTY